MLFQSYAGFLSCRADWTVQAFSESLALKLGVTDQIHAGARIDDLLGRQFLHDLRGWSQSSAVSAETSTQQNYQLNGLSFDITCKCSADDYRIVFEPAPAGTRLPPDTLVKRFIKRLRGLSSRQQVLQAAAQILRLTLRSDSVSIVSQNAEHCLTVHTCAQKRENPLLSNAMTTDITAQMLLCPGIIADCSDPGTGLAGSRISDHDTVAPWIQYPDAELNALIAARGYRSAYWNTTRDIRHTAYCVLSEKETVGPTDMARRQAAGLAQQVLMLIIDAEHPV